MPELASKAGKSRGKDIATEGERVPAAQAEGTERTRDRPVYAPRVDIIETEEALEIFADMAGVSKDSVEVNARTACTDHSRSWRDLAAWRSGAALYGVPAGRLRARLHVIGRS